MKPVRFRHLVLLTAICGVKTWGGEPGVCTGKQIEAIGNLDNDTKRLGKTAGMVFVGDSVVAGTGTLISRDLFLTSGSHIGACDNTFVAFNMTDMSMFIGPYECKEIVERGKAGQDDYVILRLEDYPGTKQSWSVPVTDLVDREQDLAVFFHPRRDSMKVSRKGCHLSDDRGGGAIDFKCDVQAGAEGGPIMLPTLNSAGRSQLVGMITGLTCDGTPKSSNRAISMRHLMQISPTLKALYPTQPAENKSNKPVG